MVAPGYPDFGHSAMPPVEVCEYTFDHLADVMDRFVQHLGLKQYSLYVMDYGVPIRFRLAVKHPERVQALIVQNGNAYEEGPPQLLQTGRPEANAPANLCNAILTHLARHVQPAHCRATLCSEALTCYLPDRRGGPLRG